MYISDRNYRHFRDSLKCLDYFPQPNTEKYPVKPNKLFNVQAIGYWVVRDIDKYGKIDYKDRFSPQERKDKSLS